MVLSTLSFVVLFCSISSGYERYDNVVFRKIQEVTTSHSKWLITLVHDLQPYEDFIQHIKTDLKQVRRYIDTMSNKFHQSGEKVYVSTLLMLRKEVKLINDIHQGLLLSFGHYKDLSQTQTRSRRALLPIVGDISSFLFGTVTEGDLQDIRSNIGKLAENQGRIIHDVKQSMSLINMSRVYISENRKAIKDLVEYVSSVEERLDGVTELLLDRVYSMEQFLNQFSQLTLILNEIKQATQRAVLYLENLRMDMNMLTMYHLSPSTISPGDLRDLLLEIEKQLPNSLSLPENVNNIWFYYKTLHCQAIAQGETIFIVITIPLLDFGDKYDLFEAYNLPLPLSSNGTIQTGSTLKNNIQMTGHYHLETNSFLINKDRTKFALLTNDEFAQCRSQYLRICSPASAIYPTNLNHFCVTALFLKKETLIKKYCKIMIIPYSVLPQAVYLNAGVWAIATQNPLKLTLVCRGENAADVTAQPPLFFVKLNNSCHATNDYLALPMYFEKSTSVGAQDPLETLLTTQELTRFEILNDFQKVMEKKNLTLIPESLKSLKEVPMLTFANQLDSYQAIDLDNQPLPDWVRFLINGAISLGLGLIIYVVWQMKGNANFRSNFSKICCCCCFSKGVDKPCHEEPAMAVSYNQQEGVTIHLGDKTTSPQSTERHNELCRLYPDLCSENKRAGSLPVVGTKG